MKTLRFSGAFTAQGWISPAFIELDPAGKIVSISQQAPGAAAESIEGYAIPGFRNCHSHSFQFAMAGLAEHLGQNNNMDDFWSWREAMYDLALKLGPDALEAIAAQLYAEMLARGYTSVVEFHYLHNDPNGNRYGNPAELAERLIVAALRAGIRLTLVPVYYRQGDFGAPAGPKQRRFLSKSVEEFFSLVSATEKAVKVAGAQLPGRLRSGLGVHSLRAASEADFREIVSRRRPGQPFHMHVAEQAKEVNACYNVLKKRPVEWLLENAPLGPDFSLVHCTHMTPQETQGLAKSGATVVLCPSTEGNLGDGFFPFESYMKHQGKWTIGTDSHIGLSPMEELRWLDYGQRLRNQKRNTICFAPREDSGEKLYRESVERGAVSAGESSPAIAPGAYFDAAVLDSALLPTTNPERLLSTIVFAADSRWISRVYVSGKALVENGRHVQESGIRRDFLEQMRGLATRV